MGEKEGSLIVQTQIEVLASTSKGNAPYPYPEEWVLWYPRSSNHRSASTNIFKDVYFLCRDTIMPDKNAHDIFWFFYNSKVRECPASNPWEKNLGKL